VHLAAFYDVPPEWQDEALALKWQAIRAIRKSVTEMLEGERRDGRIRSSLEASLQLGFADGEAWLTEDDWAELCIVSRVHVALSEKASFAVEKAPGRKCARCWKVLEEVGGVAAHPMLCLRCADAVDSGLVARAA